MKNRCQRRTSKPPRWRRRNRFLRRRLQRIRMTCSSPRRRTTHERNVGNSEGRAVGGRRVPSGYGAGRNARLFLCAPSCVRGKHAIGGASEARPAGGATHTVAGINERSESAGGHNPVAASHRVKSDSRSDRCAARASPPKRTRPDPRDPHAGTKTQVRRFFEEPRTAEKTQRLEVNQRWLLAHSNFYDELAGVSAGEEHVDGIGRLFQSFHDGFAVLQLTEHFPLTQLLRSFHEARSEIQDDEPLDAEAFHYDCAEAEQAGIFLGVARDEATDHDAAVEIHAIQNFLHDFSADVFKIDVNAVGSGRGKPFLPVRMLVVDGGVEAEILGDPCAFVVAAGDADDAAAVNLSNLSDDAAGSASGGGDDERFALLRRSDFHAEKRGESVEAEHPEEKGVRNEGNLWDFLEDVLRKCIDDDVLLEASHCRYARADV